MIRNWRSSGQGPIALPRPARGTPGPLTRAPRAGSMGRSFRVEEAGIDALPERLEIGEVAPPPSDPEVVGVVEGGLGAGEEPIVEGG